MNRPGTFSNLFWSFYATIDNKMSFRPASTTPTESRVSARSFQRPLSVSVWNTARKCAATTTGIPRDSRQPSNGRAEHGPSITKLHTATKSGVISIWRGAFQSTTNKSAACTGAGFAGTLAAAAATAELGHDDDVGDQQLATTLTDRRRYRTEHSERAIRLIE